MRPSQAGEGSATLNASRLVQWGHCLVSAESWRSAASDGSVQGDISAGLAVTSTRITGPTWARGPTAADSREELLSRFVGTAITAALVTGSTRAGGAATATSREHLLSEGRTDDQGKRCQNARQTSGDDALHHVLNKRGRSGASATGTKLPPTASTYGRIEHRHRPMI